MEIILDLGSGNTCRNDIGYGKRMIDEVAAIDTRKHKVIFKMQLFRDQPPNEHLARNVFANMYAHAKQLGYQMTASVFDTESLKFLLTFKDLPFIKIACRPELYWLIGEMPRNIPVYASMSFDTIIDFPWNNGISLFCIPKYPAPFEDYDKYLSESEMCAVSDHSPGLELFKKYQDTLSIWEKHLVLEHDDKNPDGGVFAVTPEELSEIL